MVEEDTVKILRECDAGCKMGVASIDDVSEYVKDEKFKSLLVECKREHEELSSEINGMLERFHDDGKEPNPIAKGMSWMKTNVKLAMCESDATIADLMTDGCDMGVKSLSKYLNKYKAASEESKDVAKRLIKLEEELGQNIRGYL